MTARLDMILQRPPAAATVCLSLLLILAAFISPAWSSIDRTVEDHSVDAVSRVAALEHNLAGPEVLRHESPLLFTITNDDPTPNLVGSMPSPSLVERQNIQPSVAPQDFQSSNIPVRKIIAPNQVNVYRVTEDLLRSPRDSTISGLPEDLIEADNPVQSQFNVTKRSLEDDPGDNHESRADGDLGGRLEARQLSDPVQLYLSINTCAQPTWNSTGTQTGPPSQLTMYVSTSIATPGPRAPIDQQTIIPLEQGFANYTANVTSQVYVAISAPDQSTGFQGQWSYEVAASIDDFYHRANAVPFLYLIDTDTAAALLVTDNLTQTDNGSTIYERWLNLSPPFVAFVQKQNDSAALNGTMNSYCALSTMAEIKASQDDLSGEQTHVEMSMVTRGLGNKPKQQFHVSSLEGATQYSAYLAMRGNSTSDGSGVVGGGGQVWSPVQFTTKQGGNCQLLYNLDFCSEVAYAVPSNPNTFNTTDVLAARYDNHAANLYRNFTYSLQLIPCNTTSSAQYSLAKNCTDCAKAYKEWLCAVTMPRCEDFSLDAPYSQPRNMGQRFFQNTSFLTESLLQQPFDVMPGAPAGSIAQKQTYASNLASNSSRNPIITDEIQPGPYNELLPCEDLCYSLVQSCPAALGFGCPLPGKGLEVGYSPRQMSGLTCSYLGAYYFVNEGTRQGGTWVGTWFGVVLAVLWSLL